MIVLSPKEIRDLTDKVRLSAQARELDAMGIPYKRRRNGTLCVYRIHVEGPQAAGAKIEHEPELILDTH
jgi:hypothetical protein